MTKVTVEEFEANPSRYEDEAQQHPVVIVRDGKPATILLSLDEYVRLLRRDRAGLAGELAHVDAVLAWLTEDPETSELGIGARVVRRDAESGTVVVEVMIPEELLQQASELGIDVSAAAVAGIEAAVEQAKSRKA